MARIPYELVSIEGDKILQKVWASKTMEEMYDYYDQHLEYLKQAGWTDEEFDRETEKRLDERWEDKPKPLPPTTLN